MKLWLVKFAGNCLISGRAAQVFEQVFEEGVIEEKCCLCRKESLSWCEEEEEEEDGAEPSFCAFHDQ